MTGIFALLLTFSAAHAAEISPEQLNEITQKVVDKLGSECLSIQKSETVSVKISNKTSQHIDKAPLEKKLSDVFRSADKNEPVQVAATISSNSRATAKSETINYEIKAKVAQGASSCEQSQSASNTVTKLK